MTKDDRRFIAACHAMGGMLANSGTVGNGGNWANNCSPEMVAEDAMKFADALLATLEPAPEQPPAAEPDEAAKPSDVIENWEAEVLEMIVEELSHHPCMHGPAGSDHGNTPPMMYPEWIRCVINQAKIDSSPSLAATIAQRDAVIKERDALRERVKEARILVTDCIIPGGVSGITIDRLLAALTPTQQQTTGATT